MMKKTTSNLRAFRVISEWRQYKNTTRHHHHWTSPVHSATNPYTLRERNTAAVLYCRELFLRTQRVRKRTSFTGTSRGNKTHEIESLEEWKTIEWDATGEVNFPRPSSLSVIEHNEMKARRGETSQWWCSYCNCCPDSLSVPSNENTDMSFVICWSISQNRARQTSTAIFRLSGKVALVLTMMMISGLLEFDFLLIAWQDPSMINRIALIMGRRASLFCGNFHKRSGRYLSHSTRWEVPSQASRNKSQLHAQVGIASKSVNK